jgi:hypothetical protein
MEGKLFLLDKGHVVVRNSSGVEVAFNTIDELNSYYSGNIDLSGEYYIDYEPQRKLFYYNNDPTSVEALENLYEESPFIQEYEDVIADVDNMREKINDPYFGMALKEARAYKLAQIKSMTYRTISEHMPQWKQLRWNDYIKIYEKQDRGETLSPLEQAIFDRFPDEGESHRSCYENVIRAMEWILDCVAENDKKEVELQNVKTIKQLRNIKDTEYPDWPL